MVGRKYEAESPAAKIADDFRDALETAAADLRGLGSDFKYASYITDSGIEVVYDPLEEKVRHGLKREHTIDEDLTFKNLEVLGSEWSKAIVKHSVAKEAKSLRTLSVGAVFYAGSDDGEHINSFSYVHAGPGAAIETPEQTSAERRVILTTEAGPQLRLKDIEERAPGVIEPMNLAVNAISLAVAELTRA